MASINEKLDYINETKSLIKDGLNNLGSEITSQTTFRGYVDEIEDLYEEWPKVNSENTSISLNNIKKGKLNIRLKGNISQDGEPTPDTLQNVNVVTGDNTINVEGKNLFNSFALTKEKVQEDGTIVLSNVVSANGYHSTGKKLKELCPSLKVEDVVYLYLDTDWTIRKSIYGNHINNWLNGQVKTITEDMLNDTIIVYGGYQTTSNIKIMVTKELDTSYTPYVSQTYPINLGTIELCKIGNYQDFPFKAINGNEYYDTLTEEQKNTLNYGNWYVHKGNIKYDLGTLNWIFENSATTPVNRTVLRLTGTNAKSSYFSNIFDSNKQDDTTVANRLVTNFGYSWYVSLEDSLTGISSSDTNAEKIEKMKAYLLSKNAILITYLATSTDTQITNTTLISQLDNLYNAKSYDVQTNISQVNDNLPFIINASALMKNSN